VFGSLIPDAENQISRAKGWIMKLRYFFSGPARVTGDGMIEWIRRDERRESGLDQFSFRSAPIVPENKPNIL
jgi:hypothetical protein